MRIDSLFNNWPQKLGALGLSVLIWYFVSLSDNTTVQRNLILPLSVEGIQANEIVTGLPEIVEIAVEGEAERINRLRPENFDAVLDLQDESGDFEKEINILSPQDVSLENVTPGSVIGRIETVTTKTVPVTVSFLGALPDTVLLEPSPSVPEVAARGRSSSLTRVTQVIAALPAESGETTVELFAADATGQPVTDIVLEPITTDVSVSETPILHSKLVPLVLDMPSLPRFSIQNPEPSTNALELVGPLERLEEIEEVSGSVEFTTNNLSNGGYTLPVNLDLPAGVGVLEQPTVSLRLARLPISE